MGKMHPKLDVPGNVGNERKELKARALRGIKKTDFFDIMMNVRMMMVLRVKYDIILCYADLTKTALIEVEKIFI